VSSFSILQARKTLRYRLFESLVGLSSLLFIITLVFLAFIQPALLGLFLILYSFLMVMKVFLHGIYTLSSYKNLLRWENVDWQQLIQNLSENLPEARGQLKELKSKFSTKLNWEKTISKDLQTLDKIQNTKFAKPQDIFHIPIFSVYNESSEVLIRSLKSIYDSGYNLGKIMVIITQEARVGNEKTTLLYNQIAQTHWLNCYQFNEKDLNIVYGQEHPILDYQNTETDKINFDPNKLTVVFTQHPDGLVGEIKGKASNEDWGARQGSLIVQSKKIDPELVLVTSLDSDSRVGVNFFQMLSYRYCLTEDRANCGFQPLPVYSNNFFSSNLFPRLVATNTTIWYMIQYSLLDELHFFANYAVPLTILRKVDFWVREVIAEDNLLFAKCFIGMEGKLRVVPFYGRFEGDVVEGDDYIQAIDNQYKQLQRWAWGGVEGVPYKLESFYFRAEGQKLPFFKKTKIVFNEYINHFFWATLPVVFGFVTFLPQIVGGINFQEDPVSLNLRLFSTYFAWISFIFLIISAYVFYTYIAVKATQNFKPKKYQWAIVGLQWIVSPFIYLFWAFPAIDAQLRGVMGWYMGYWVTPKKN
jgi:hypothetical protein